MFFFEAEKVVFLKKDFEGVPGGLLPWDHHQLKEEILLHKTVSLPAKVYYFAPPPVAL